MGAFPEQVQVHNYLWRHRWRQPCVDVARAAALTGRSKRRKQEKIGGVVYCGGAQSEWHRMNRIDLINNITRYLTILKTEVEMRNALNLQDINVHAETFFRLLLNLLLELDLKNINIVDRSATAIDLGTMSRASPSR
tara:strand:+ start:629 stop:1039 length:411 start_codon:yes stop_codon:yes gene_type:complete